ncbi:MAG: hypothetical protein JKX85_05495 [Phycisphaeraceae bacterium]|nr:hypothetical protein [Phycisphaeraceae bacterium]
MDSLFARLSIALLLIFATLGGGFFIIEQWSTRQYYEELTQRLNAPIAMYVTDHAPLIINGKVNYDEMDRLAQQTMMVNPTAEVYLLDPTGHILSHALPPNTVQLDKVDIEPLQALIDNAEPMPIRGLDPRNPDRTKIFSAHPVMTDGQLQGYLYVILGGRKYDELASSLRGSYVGKVSFSAIIALVIAAFLAGLLVLNLLTGRLTRLTNAVQAFTDSDFAIPNSKAISELQASKSEPTSRDEISRLTTAVNAMANKIEEQFNGLKETDRLRRELINNVSHDLRTPLASMLGYVDTLLLKNGQLRSAERQHYLKIVRKHTSRLEVMIGDLFELSKLEAGSVQPCMESFPLAELLQDVCQEFELEATQRDIDITFNKEPTATLVYADIALVQRVLENLLRNALNSTTNGGRISLELKALADKVAVAVVDTGCGIPADKLDTIFERFYSSGTSRSLGVGPDNGSSGLGLAIVKRILDLHGCRITVSSIVDKGSCFEFELPMARLA